MTSSMALITNVPFWMDRDTVRTINQTVETAKQKYIEKIVGDVNCADPDASLLMRIHYFAVDCFNAATDLLAILVGSKNAMAQAEMRSNLHRLAEQLNSATPPSRNKEIDPMSRARDFFNRAHEVLKPTPNPLSHCPKFNPLPLPKNSLCFPWIPREELLDLLESTLDALAKARRNPIPALSSKKNIELIRNAFLPVKPQEPSSAVPTRSLFASFTSFFGL